MEDQPLDEVQWRAPEWIQMFGLRTDNVLEYFALSPFWDRTANNQVLKMQTQYSEAQQPGAPPRTDMLEQLKKMQGTEFVVYLANEATQLWIIRKQERLSPNEVRLLATYFVVGENIYMAPSIYDVIASRMLSTTKYLSDALNKAVSLPSYSPSQGYSYVTDRSLSVDSGNNPTANKKPASAKSTNATPMTNGQTPASSQQQSGSTTSIMNPVDEYKSSMYMERALVFTNANTTRYLDVETDPPASLELPHSRVGTPVTTSPRKVKRPLPI